MKQVNTPFCFCIERSTNLRTTHIVFLVPRSGITFYCTCDISTSDLSQNRFLKTLRTSLVTWLIKLIVRCFSHFAVLLTFGRVMNTELLIFSGKQPSWYIIFVKLVSSVNPASPDATSISVKMFNGIPLEQTILLFWQLVLICFRYIPVEYSLCCRHIVLLCVHAIVPISCPGL